MEWYKSRSSERPSETDTTSSEKYNYVRKNIVEVNEEEGTYFEYDEAKVLKEDWGIYLELIQAKADIEYLNMVTEDM